VLGRVAADGDSGPAKAEEEQTVKLRTAIKICNRIHGERWLGGVHYRMATQREATRVGLRKQDDERMPYIPFACRSFETFRDVFDLAMFAHCSG
jgi:hypothetical protein